MHDLTLRNPYLKEEFLNFITHEHDYFEIEKNTKLYTQTWTPKNAEPKAKVLFLHGYREHSSLYTEYMVEICKLGITVHAIDYEGHGFSTGLKGYVYDFHKFVDTIVQYLEKIRESYKGKLFVFGISLGGFFALNLGLKRPNLIDGLILLSPFIKNSPESSPPSFILPILMLLAYLFPTWPLIEANRGRSCIDAETEEELLKDKYSYAGRMRLGTALQLLNAISFIEPKLKEIDVPFLLLLGSDDKACDILGGKMLYEKAKTNDKTMRIFEKFAHDLLHDKRYKQVEGTYLEWIQKRL